MRKLIVLSVAILIAVPKIMAQTSDTVRNDSAKKEELGEKIKKVTERVTIVESVREKLKKGEPAQFSFTEPLNDTAKSSYLINAAIGIDLVSNETAFTSLTLEWQKNTLIDKEQDKYFIGIADNRRFGGKYDWLESINEVSSINYARDREDKTEEIIFTSYWTLVFENPEREFFGYLTPDDIHPAGLTRPIISKIIQYSYDLTPGFEYQNKYQAEDQNKEGSIYRGYFKVDAHIYPMGNLIDQAVDLFWNWTYRDDFSNSTSSGEETSKLKKYGVSLNFKFEQIGKSKNPILKLSFERIEGSDPIKGRLDQKYNQLALKLRF